MTSTPDHAVTPRHTEHHPLAGALLRKLFLAYLAFALILAVVLGSLESRRIRREVLGTLHNLTQTFTPAAESALWEYQFPLLETLANGIGANPVVVAVEIRDANGLLRASWQAGGDARPSPGLQVHRDLRRLNRDGSARSLGTLLISSNETVIQGQLKGTFIKVGSAGLILLLVMMFLLWSLTRVLIVDRLERMAEYARTLDTEAEEQPPVPDLGGARDEVTDLARTLNSLRLRLLGRIQELQEAKGHISEMNQDLLRAVARAESANQAKTLLLQRMSHEFLTPLNHVQLHVELIRGTLETSDPEVLGDLQSIHQAVRDLADQIVDILEWVELETSTAPALAVPLDPGILTRTLKARAGLWAAARRNTLQIDLEGLPAGLETNAEALVQALSKLLHNACRFTEAGQVSLSVSKVGTEAVFEVRDTGKGISAKDLDRVFEVFSQGDEGLTRAYGGMGLGLAIGQHLVRKMGGRLSVESQLGVGSVFRLHLPWIGAAPLDPARR
jgi:signal transduction histidine kinase